MSKSFYYLTNMKWMFNNFQWRRQRASWNSRLLEVGVRELHENKPRTQHSAALLQICSQRIGFQSNHQVNERLITKKCLILREWFFRTTTYDSRSGGFLTSVSTEAFDFDEDIEEDDENDRDDDERLVITQDTYNYNSSLTRTPSPLYLPMKRKMSQDQLLCKIVKHKSIFIFCGFIFSWFGV